MVIISQKAIHDFATKYPLAADALNRWCKVASQANWRNFLEVKESFNATDYIGNDRYVFDIGGNKYRLVRANASKKDITPSGFWLCFCLHFYNNSSLSGFKNPEGMKVL